MLLYIHEPKNLKKYNLGSEINMSVEENSTFTKLRWRVEKCSLPRRDQLLCTVMYCVIEAHAGLYF